MQAKARKKWTRVWRSAVVLLVPLLLLAAGAAVWMYVPASDGLPRTLHSRNVLLVRRQDGAVIGERRADERIYPASMTKIMTALIALEQAGDLDKTVRISPEMVEGMQQQNAVQAGFLPGEEVPVIDLIYGAILPSGAECCMALACETAGDEQSFVALMNERAGQLNMKDTHFTGVVGLHDDEHYTTARDMAVLLEAALQNADFRGVFTSRRHSTGPTNLHPDGITVRSSVFDKLESDEFPGGRLLGGKTGYTTEAGLCLASLAEKNGEEYILVTAGAEGSARTAPHHIEDAVTVMKRLH